MPKSGRCPVCRRPAIASFAPFCSDGCKSRDLLRWLGEGYAIPGPPADPDAGDAIRGDLTND